MHATCQTQHQKLCDKFAHAQLANVLHHVVAPTHGSCKSDHCAALSPACCWKNPITIQLACSGIYICISLQTLLNASALLDEHAQAVHVLSENMLGHSMSSHSTCCTKQQALHAVSEQGCPEFARHRTHAFLGSSSAQACRVKGSSAHG